MCVESVCIHPSYNDKKIFNLHFKFPFLKPPTPQKKNYLDLDDSHK